MRLSTPCEGRTFESLAEVVASARAGVTRPGMFLQYDATPVEAFARDGSVVLLLTDSAAIVDLFGLRPDSVETRWRSSHSEEGHWTDTVPVQYVSPSLPELDSAFVAESRTIRQAWETSIRRTSRTVSAWDADWEAIHGTIRLAVGDSVHVGVSEVRCVHDLCSRQELSVPDSAWSVDDSAVATLHLMEPRPDLRAYVVGEVHMLSPVLVRGEAPGRTRVRVSGIPVQEDAPPSRIEVLPTVEVEVVVIEQVRRPFEPGGP